VTLVDVDDEQIGVPSDGMIASRTDRNACEFADDLVSLIGYPAHAVLSAPIEFIGS